MCFLIDMFSIIFMMCVFFGCPASGENRIWENPFWPHEEQEEQSREQEAECSRKKGVCEHFYLDQQCLGKSLVPLAPFSLVGFYSERCNLLNPLAGDLSFAQVWSRHARSWASRASARLMDPRLRERHSMQRPRPSMPTLEKFNFRQFELAW